MKGIQTSSLAALALLGALSASAANPDTIQWPDYAVAGISLEKSDSHVVAAFDLAPDAFSLKANREVTIIPLLAAGSDTLKLPAVTVAGRTRYFQHRRARDIEAPDILIRNDDPLHYSAITDYKDWMAAASLILDANASGCCGAPKGILPARELATLSAPESIMVETAPELPLNAAMIYVAPNKEAVKTRSLSGKAYIDFPVNQTGIYPDYRRNPEELASIQNIIDQIRADHDVSITSISFKGYASPEGPYENNERLAKGRTEALMGYVRALYSFPDSVMRISWEAEDWGGLTMRLLDLDIPNRDAIYDIIVDPSLSYDEKDLAIKNRFPTQYAYLLKEVYPALRHSDYIVIFKVRNYIDIDEIEAVYETNPSKLSNEELFLYAQTFPRDSDEYREVMATAVRLFPSDPEANFNAGVASMAVEDFDKALSYLRIAQELGMAEAEGLIRQITDYVNATSRFKETQKTE